ASHYDFHSGAHGVRNVFGRDAAVNLDPEGGPTRGSHRSQLAHLIEHEGNELLSSKARIHRHHQYVVHHVQDLIEHPHRRCGIDNHARPGAVVGDHFQGAVQVHAGFLMHGNPVGARVHKGGDVLVRVFDHQVYVERQPRDLAEAGYHGRANGDVGNKVAVHHVNMQEGRPPV